MIDTSKAVRPCVEELAGWVNTGLIPYSVQPLFHWWDVKDYFKESATNSGVTYTNNNDGTFNVSGNAVANRTYALNTSPIPLHYKPKNDVKLEYIQSTNYTIVTYGVLLVFTIPHALNTYTGNASLAIQTIADVTINGNTSTINTTTLMPIGTLACMNVPLSGAISGNVTATDISVDYDSIKFNLTYRYIRSGSVNVRHALIFFDLCEIVNSESIVETITKLHLNEAVDLTQKYLLEAVRHTTDIVSTIQFTVLENYLWKIFDGSFSTETNIPNVVIESSVLNNSFRMYS